MGKLVVPFNSSLHLKLQINLQGSCNVKGVFPPIILGKGGFKAEAWRIHGENNQTTTKADGYFLWAKIPLRCA